MPADSAPCSARWWMPRGIDRAPLIPWTAQAKAIILRLMLNIIRHDGPDGPTPLLIAHGLYGSGRNWGVIAKRLSSDRT